MNKGAWIIIGILLIGVGYYVGSQAKPTTLPTNNISPTPTVSFTLQRQCGIDAREFMKQHSGESLLESSYSTKLQTCIAYTESNANLNSPNYNPTTPEDKSVYDVSANRTLGGYIYIAASAKYPVDSEYWINTQANPGGQKVSTDEFDNWIQSLGLHIFQ